MSLPRRAFDTARIALAAAKQRQAPYWPTQRIEHAQRARVRAIVRHAYESVPFYRRTMDQLGLRPADFKTVQDLTRLPLLDSKLVREQVDDFCSRRVGESRRLGLFTSGTLSHVTKQIYWDHPALLRQLAYAERDRGIVNALVGRGWGQRQLFIFFPNSSTMKMRAFWNARTLSPRGLAERRVVSMDTPLEEVARTIDTFRPDIVFSFGSYAEAFFRTLADQGRTLAAPRVWMYGGDGLSPSGRVMIESRFGVRVYSSYQAVETGRFGFECERGDGFHLNVDLCAARLIADDDSPVATGEPGEIVISNL